jgi:hypothetical protein
MVLRVRSSVARFGVVLLCVAALAFGVVRLAGGSRRVTSSSSTLATGAKATTTSTSLSPTAPRVPTELSTAVPLPDLPVLASFTDRRSREVRYTISYKVVDPKVQFESYRAVVVGKGFKVVTEYDRSAEPTKERGFTVAKGSSSISATLAQRDDGASLSLLVITPVSGS